MTSFGKAPRFVEAVERIQGADVPAPGKYNPKFDTDLANSAKKGTSVYKPGRFQPVKYDDTDGSHEHDTFAQPNSLPCTKRLRHLSQPQLGSTTQLKSVTREGVRANKNEDKLKTEINELHAADCCESLTELLRKTEEEHQAKMEELKSSYQLLKEQQQNKVAELSQTVKQERTLRDNEAQVHKAQLLELQEKSDALMVEADASIQESRSAYRTLEQKSTECSEKVIELLQTLKQKQALRAEETQALKVELIQLQEKLEARKLEASTKADEFQSMGRKYLESIENIRTKLVSASEVHRKLIDKKKENSDLLGRLKSLDLVVDLKSTQIKQLEGQLVEERKGRMEVEVKLDKALEKVSELSGHTNIRQKIHHLQNLKRELAACEEENTKLKREAAKLQGQLGEAQRLAFKY